MYGGVSLAIYINGVAQELLNMVRATAPAPKGSTNPSGLLLDKNDDDTKEELEGTAAVYRKLGQYLCNHDKLTASATQDEKGKLPTLTNDPIKTRFIVDVISGTSAGGINGVFLAKAIVRNQKMDGLKQLWLREGDLRKLLNDSFSVSDLAGFSVREPQQSLLNSQRMYRKLLEALDEMDQSKSKRERKENEARVSPLVGELDLFITTTDIEGIPLPIKLADDVVYERRYKNVFHFRYATKDATGSTRDDFIKSNDPFLAFAARCTSSFPFAFEAMCLADIRDVLARYPVYTEQLLDEAAWDKFFSEYLCLGLYDLDKGARRSEISAWPRSRSQQAVEQGTAADIQAARKKLRSSFQSRPFGDGGYLDNKPFTHATRMLMRRWVGNVFVDRKLLYVEPSPEHPELAPPPPVDRRPDFAENVRAAVMDLPRHETIREDLAQINERNETIRRANKLTETVDSDVEAYRQQRAQQRADLIKRLDDCKTDVPAELEKYLTAEALPTNEFREAGLSQMIAIYGIGYGGYHRLRVEETTQLLSDIVTRIAGHDPASDAADMIREIAEEWRRMNYAEEKGKEGKGTGIAKMENEFLYEFDLAYRLRRLAFLSRRVNDLGRLKDEGKLHPTAIALLYGSVPKSIGKAQITSLDWVKTFREELQQLKKILGLATIEARVAAEQLFHPTVENDLSNAQKEAIESGAILSDDRIKSLWDDPAFYFSYRLFALVRKLGLRWKAEDKEEPSLSNLLEKSASKRISLIRNLLGTDQRLATLQQLADTIRAAFRAPNSADLRVRLQQNDVLPNDAQKVARECLLYYYNNFTFYDVVSYPIQYGTSVGEANIVDVFRVSPEDATALIDEQKVGEHRRKLAGTALMSFGAFIDPAWRKNDMLWGRLDGAERIITALLPPSTDEEDPYKAVRQNLIREAHISIFKEEVHQTDLTTLQALLGNMLGRIEPTTAQAQTLRGVVQAAIADNQTLPVAIESALRACFKDPSQVRDYYEKQFEVNRRFDPENALRLISRATEITGRMLEGLANKIDSDPAKRASAWIARFGSVFWGMVAVAVPSSLGNLLARHWLGLLYVLSFITLVLSIWVPWMAPAGWSALGISVSLNLLLFVLGDIIRGRRFWSRALTTLLVVLIVALIAGGVLFAVEQLNAALKDYETKQFMTTAGRLLAGAVAGLILIAFVAREWHKGLQQYLVAPHRSFDEGGLKWVIVVTLGFLVLLYGIGPRDIVKLEFAGTPEAGSTFLQNTNAATVRLQLGVDYLFIIAYTVMMASFCIAAAKLFWNAFNRWEDRLRKEKKTVEQIAATDGIANTVSHPQGHLSSVSRKLAEAWPYLVAFGFFLAAMQCIAGLCDAAENTGLLWFLSTGTTVGLTVSFYCATVKFVLVSLGALYATVGFSTGIFTNKSGRILLIVCATLSVLVLIFAVLELRFHPGLNALLHPRW